MKKWCMCKTSLEYFLVPPTETYITLGYTGKGMESMTRACVRVSSLQIFTENLVYAQYQNVLGTQLSSLVPTAFSESVITSQAFHSPHCPPVAMVQYWVTVDCWMEQKPGPQMGQRQTQYGWLLHPSCTLQKTPSKEYLYVTVIILYFPPLFHYFISVT